MKKDSEVAFTYLNIRNIISNVANVRVKGKTKNLRYTNEDMVCVKLTVCVYA